MKNKAVAFVLIVFIYGVLFSGFGWVVKKNTKPPVQIKQSLIDSLKIDSITIKIYKDG